jgi:hypothetical protein
MLIELKRGFKHDLTNDFLFKKKSILQIFEL